MPVTTRHQSGSLLAGPSSEAPELVWDELESDVFKEEPNDTSGEGSDNADIDDDFEETLRVAKRRKLENAAAPGNTSSSKSSKKLKRAGISRGVQGRLQNMLSLPLDVLYTIFSTLRPIDLLTLARTSKDLRRLLMSRKSLWVWITARRNAGETRVPDPPEDMSEPAWALLLFGPAVCSVCSTKNVFQIDFALRRRLCAACRKRNLVFSLRFRTQCPGMKECIMNLLPYTKFGGWAHGRVSNSRFYWKPDLHEIGKKIAELEEDRDAGKPGAQQRLKSFRAERILFADTIIQSCAEYEKWAADEALVQVRNHDERRAQRREALKERILAAGYDTADIEWIGFSSVPGANVDKPLTEKGWRSIRSKVENMLSTAREDRLFAERRQREREYKDKAMRCYSGLMRQILPMQRLYLPSLSQVGELSCFRELLNPDRDVQPAEWEHAATRLPRSLSEWMSEHRDRYSSLLPSQVCGSQDKAMEVKLLSDPSIELGPHEAMDRFAGRLDLAISVFRHLDTNTIHVGRDVCHAWKMKGELEFLERGAEAARALLELLKLDPATTTASMLDQLDRHFVCATCPAERDWLHRPWKSCILHFIDCSETDHPHPEWHVVCPDEAGRTCMSLNYPPRAQTWLCNHCSDYLAPEPNPFVPILLGQTLRAGSKEDAIKHVQTEHNVDDPAIDVDLFAYPYPPPPPSSN